MRRPGIPSSDGSRTAVIVTLLLVSLGTTGLLAVQAHYAVTSHRATAERVLRDYARLAAQEFIRRSAAELGYGGYYTLITALGRHAARRGLEPNVAELLAAEGDERLNRALPLARRFFMADTARREIRFTGDGPDSETRAWLESQLEKPRPAKSAYSVAHGLIGGKPRTFVYSKIEGAPASIVVGFDVELETTTDWLRAAFASGPLIPASVGEGKVTNKVLFLALSDHGGIERFRSGPERWRELGVTVPYGNGYGGVLEGATVESSINPEAAHHLVIGGLPRSRLPVLAGLLLLTAGLVATAMLQLRKERALQRLRAEFVSSVSHELRTPLAQIRMFAETLLLERVRTAEEGKRSLEIINREVTRLTHLVENVLHFSRSERQGVVLSDEMKELAPLLRDVVALFEPLAVGKGARVSTRFEEGVHARCDADALRQVVLNLLDNAVKYGPREQEILLGLERRDGWARIYVEDHGPGIPPAERSRIFNRFHRLERDRSSTVAGTGIGLAVVRELVLKHRGRSFVEPSAEGGARFVVEIPALGGKGGALSPPAVGDSPEPRSDGGGAPTTNSGGALSSPAVGGGAPTTNSEV